MLRRHSIGILLFLLIFVGWAIFYQPAPQSSRDSFIQDFTGYLGESTWAASGAEQSSAERDETHERDAKPDIDYYAHLKPQHREVLQEWLNSKRYLRPAVEEVDNFVFREDQKADLKSNLEFLRSSLGENNYQYYSVGDMNHDGKEDFAVLLVDTRGYPDDLDHFSLAIFNAPFRTENWPAYYEDDLSGISNVFIDFRNAADGRHLFLGIFESDALCATYYPRGKTYYFKDCEE